MERRRGGDRRPEGAGRSGRGGGRFHQRSRLVVDGGEPRRTARISAVVVGSTGRLAAARPGHDAWHALLAGDCRARSGAGQGGVRGPGHRDRPPSGSRGGHESRRASARSAALDTGRQARRDSGDNGDGTHHRNHGADRRGASRRVDIARRRPRCLGDHHAPGQSHRAVGGTDQGLRRVDFVGPSARPVFGTRRRGSPIGLARKFQQTDPAYRVAGSRSKVVRSNVAKRSKRQCTVGSSKR